MLIGYCRSPTARRGLRSLLHRLRARRGRGSRQEADDAARVAPRWRRQRSRPLV